MFPNFIFMAFPLPNNNHRKTHQFCSQRYNSSFDVIGDLSLFDQIDPPGFRINAMGQFPIRISFGQGRRRMPKTLPPVKCTARIFDLARLHRNLVTFRIDFTYRFSYKSFFNDNFVIKKKNRKELIKNYNIACDTENVYFASRQRVENYCTDIEKIRAARIVHHRGR